MAGKVSHKPSEVGTRSSKSSFQLTNHYHAFLCKLCNRPHPLRICRRFLAMNMMERMRAVRTHKYCPNCLAHEHSHGRCFSRKGCKHCSKFHHTLLHIHPRLQRQRVSPTSGSRSRSPDSQPSTSRAPRVTATKPSLSALLHRNHAIILPTARVIIETKGCKARCLLDSSSPISRISKKVVEKLRLTTVRMEDETMCPLVLKSCFDSSSKIEGIFRVDNRITLDTPLNSLPESSKRHFRDLVLADPEFYKSTDLDIVLGVDIFSKVTCEGILSKPGLPTAQSTLFGWIIYGTFTY